MVPTSVTCMPGFSRGHVGEEHVVCLNEERALRVCWEPVFWYPEEDWRSYGDPSPLEEWLGEHPYLHRIPDWLGPSLALEPEATCDELQAALRAVTARFPVLDEIRLNTYWPTVPLDLPLLLTNRRRLPLGVIPLRLDPPSDSLSLEWFGDQLALNENRVEDLDDLTRQIRELEPACVTVRAPPHLTLQELVDVFDAIRRVPGFEVAVGE